MKYILYLLLSLFILSCSGNSGANRTSDYDDGTYCASIQYFNAKTGTKNTYKLKVEVANNELIKINWGNGGWLDKSHFTPQEIDADGLCEFKSDQGYYYSVQILEDDCKSNDSDVNKEITMTLYQCSTIYQMSESELKQYEKNFNASRYDNINEKMCKMIGEYIAEVRKISNKSRNLDNQINDGFIERIFAINSQGNVTCQQLLVKRRGVYYWLEVLGHRGSTRGVIKFNPNIEGWQEVTVQEDPNSTTLQVFSMRIIEQSTEKYSLQERMEIYCF